MKKPFNGLQPDPNTPSKHWHSKPVPCPVDQRYSQLSRDIAFFKMEITRKLAASGLYEYYVKRHEITTRYESLAEVSKALDMRWQEWGGN